VHILSPIGVVTLTSGGREEYILPGDGSDHDDPIPLFEMLEGRALRELPSRTGDFVGFCNQFWINIVVEDPFVETSRSTHLATGIDLRHCLYALSAADHGSIRRAAETL